MRTRRRFSNHNVPVLLVFRAVESKELTRAAKIHRIAVGVGGSNEHITPPFCIVNAMGKFILTSKFKPAGDPKRN